MADVLFFFDLRIWAGRNICVVDHSAPSVINTRGWYNSKVEFSLSAFEMTSIHHMVTVAFLFAVNLQMVITYSVWAVLQQAASGCNAKLLLLC